MRPSWLLLWHLVAATATAAADGGCKVRFHPINGLLCVSSQFVETRSEAASLIQCALLCARKQRCQAFSMADGPCQLFVFDRCSKYVRDCSCSRRAQVFVRQQPGLPPGALCHAGYTDDLCGTKYKFMSCQGNWTKCRELCDSESGLVIMADVVNDAEMAAVGQLVVNKLNSLSGYLSIYLGGWQLPGSAEPSGGWQWASCSLNVSSGLWKNGEPNNSGGIEDRIGTDSSKKLIDIQGAVYTYAAGGFCECVSPFD